MSKQESTVLVLMGGPDAEREVSLCSGMEVAAALRSIGQCHVIEQVIDKPTASEICDMGGDVIFPVLHGHWGEGGPLQELLEETGRPYVGSNPQASALAMDKLVTKSMLQQKGVRTPEACALDTADECPLDPPLVIKPNDDGSSVDLRICRTWNEVADARATLHPKRGRLLAERYICGREITVGIVCGELLPLIEIVPGDSVEFYDYDAKYHRNDTQYILDPELPPGVADTCCKASRLAYTSLGCRDIARADFMVDDKGVWFLEINTMPGFTTHSLVPMAARHVGIEMGQLCAKLVETALARGHSIKLAKTATPGFEAGLRA